jgi:parallel beta-helix repeat protein
VRKLKKRNLIKLFIVLPLIFGFPTQVMDFQKEFLVNEVNFSKTDKIINHFSVKTKSIQYVEASPISIIENAGFNGFPGNGTQVDPYRIEGLNITTGSGNLISISDTDLYFRISSNFLNGLETSESGIWLNNVTNGIIKNNTIHNTNAHGIELSDSKENSISNNTILNNLWAGISLYDNSINNSIFQNSLYNNNWTGISLDFSNYNIIDENFLHSNGNGLELSSSENNTISNNNAYDNLWSGFRIYEFSHNNSITNNSVFNNGFTGIQLQNSSFNYVKDTIIQKNGFGIWLEEAPNNTLINNYLLDNIIFGFRIRDSPDNSINNNTLTNNGIIFSGSKINGYIQKSVQNNLVNEKPFIYWVNKNGGIVPNDAGQILLVNCSYITVTDQNLSNSSHGIDTVFSSYITIRNNNIQNSRVGINLSRFTNHTLVTNNTLSENLEIDVRFWSAENNNVSYNSIIGKTNKIANIALTDSKNNLISNNIIYGLNTPGIWLEYIGRTDIVDETSTTNSVKFNDFITGENVEFQAIDDGMGNIFDQNYWNDWSGKGSYIIGGITGNQDPAPLENPFHLSSPDIIIHTTGTVRETDKITVQWKSSSDSFKHPCTYSIFYTVNNGETWINLVSDLQINSITFNTEIFRKDTNILLKIQAIDSLGFISEAISDSTFFILTKLTEPTILFPNGKETLKEPVTIIWEESLDPNNLPITYSVYYSSDGGATWSLLSDQLTSTSYFWNTSLLSNGLSYLIKVVAVNSEELTNEDVSDLPFAIDNPESTVKTTIEIPNFTSLIILIVLFGLGLRKKLEKRKVKGND